LDWTVKATRELEEVVLPTSTTDISTADIEEAFGDRDFEVARRNWEGDYRRYLNSQGVKTDEGMLDMPEKLFKYRRFVEPATIVDPATADYQSVWTLDMDRTVKKPFYFPEHGIVIGLMTVMPRVFTLSEDPLSFLTSPEEYPNAQMLNAHIMKEIPRWNGSDIIGRSSIIENLWRGRHLVGLHDNKDDYLVYTPKSRIEAIYPGLGEWFDSGDQSVSLRDRVWGTTATTPVRWQGIATTRIQSPISRYGNDWRPRITLG